MGAIQEEKKYYELRFKGSFGNYWQIRGAFTELELEQCLDFNQGPTKGGKCIAIHDEQSLVKLNQPK